MTSHCCLFGSSQAAGICQGGGPRAGEMPRRRCFGRSEAVNPNDECYISIYIYLYLVIINNNDNNSNNIYIYIFIYVYQNDDKSNNSNISNNIYIYIYIYINPLCY